MRKFLIIFLVIVGIPALIALNGMIRMSEALEAEDDDPLTETDPERLAHRDAVYKKCLQGSNAAPDELYCEHMADKEIAYYTDVGFIQEIFHFGTYGLVPRFYHIPTADEEMKARLEAERLAERRGANGSTRFTGEKVAEYEEALDKLYEQSDVFLSKAQTCDPDGDLMKSLQEQRPGVSIKELHKGMDCEDWDK